MIAPTWSTQRSITGSIDTATSGGEVAAESDNAVASTDGKGWPCGICRQFMYEFAPDLKVIVGPDADHLEILTLSELLPKGFKL